MPGRNAYLDGLLADQSIVIGVRADPNWSASEVPGLTCAMGREGFLCKAIELSSRGIALNGGVEPIGVKHLEPCTRACRLSGGGNCAIAFSMSSAVVIQ